MLKVTDEGLLDIKKVQTTQDVGRYVASKFFYETHYAGDRNYPLMPLFAKESFNP